MSMFRRPIPPRRRRLTPFRRGLPRSPAAQRALRKLQEAHALMAEGRAEEAGIIFSKLASAAAKRGLPRAGQLHLQAGRAWFKAGDVQRGMNHLQQGMKLMAALGPAHRLPPIMQRVLGELRQHGFNEQATILEAEFQSLMEAHGIDRLGVPHQIRQHLPAKCDSCGGSVYPDEVEWRKHQVAICAYCGSPLQSEG